MRAGKQQETILVTGGAGYIGSRLVERALAEGYQVHVLDTVDPDSSDLRDLFRQPDLSYFQGSIANREILTEATSGVDFVINLAGVSDGRAGKEDPERTLKVNVEALDGLVMAAKASDVKRFLFASTFGVYGSQYETVLHEGLDPKPVDPYSESKLIGETILREANTDDFATTSIRFAMVYGSGPKIREDFLVNRLCMDAVTKGTLRISGGGQKRPQIHVDDVADLFLTLLRCNTELIGGKVFNAVESNPSVLQIAEAIQEFLPDIKVQILPAREQEDSFEMDSSLLFETIGFRPVIDLKVGVQKMIQHYQKALIG